MKLSLQALIEAVRLNLSPVVAAALSSCAAAMGLADVVQDGDAGELLLRAILGRPEGVGELTLTVCHLMAGEPIPLDPAETAEHPLLGPWVDADLASALSSAICAGTRATHLVLGAPTFDQISIVEGEGILAASVDLRFPIDTTAVAAIATYGEMRRSAPLLTSKVISGTALVELGRAARLRSTPPPSAPPAGSGGKERVVIAAGTGAVH